MNFSSKHVNFEINLVSIITPSHNSERFIEDTIKSVQNQSFTNWELLITDDCSSDKTAEIIKTYAKNDSRIKIFLQDENLGAASTRNVSLNNAKGQYVAFLDSDDVWSKNKLERQLDFMKKKGYAFTFSAYDLMNEKGLKINKVIPVPQTISYNQYLKNTIIGCLTVIIDRNKTGDFRMPIIRSSHDMALWLLIMRRGFFGYGLNEVLATYRLVSTSNTSKKYKAALDVWRVYTRIEHLSIFKACFYFLGYIFNALRKRL